MAKLRRIYLPRTPVNKGKRKRTGVFHELRSFRRLRSERLVVRSLVHGGVGLTTLGVATAGSAVPSSCFLPFRDKCAGPATMTTTIAATTISPTKSQKGTTARLPRGSRRSVRGRFAVACNGTTIRRLPPVLLYTQVTMTLRAMVEMTNGMTMLGDRKADPAKDSGR